MAGEAKVRPLRRGQSQRHPRRGVAILPIFPALKGSCAGGFRPSRLCGSGGDNRAKQSQFWEDRIDANPCLSKELGGSNIDHRDAKTKPIWRTHLRRVCVGRVSPLAKMKSVVRGRTTPDQVGGRLYEEAPFGGTAPGASVQNKANFRGRGTWLSADARRSWETRMRITPLRKQSQFLRARAHRCSGTSSHRFAGGVVGG